MSVFNQKQLLALLVIITQHFETGACGKTNREIGRAKAKEFEAKAAAAKDYVAAKAHQGKAKLYEGYEKAKETTQSTAQKGKETVQSGIERTKETAKSTYHTVAKKTKPAADKAKKVGQEIAGAGEQLWEDLTQSSDEAKK